MKHLENYRILIVDDTQSIHQDFHKILIPSKNDISSSIDQMHALLFDKPLEAQNENFLPPFEIDSAYQGQEALALIKKAAHNQKPYAVAFVDVMMPPGENGIETIRQIWKEDFAIQIIICTAYTKYSWEDIVNLLGKTDRLFVLKKPFDSSEITKLACQLTKKWNLNNKLKISNFSCNESAKQTKEILSTIAEDLKKYSSLKI